MLSKMFSFVVIVLVFFGLLGNVVASDVKYFQFESVDRVGELKLINELTLSEAIKNRTYHKIKYDNLERIVKKESYSYGELIETSEYFYNNHSKYYDKGFYYAPHNYNKMIIEKVERLPNGLRKKWQNFTTDGELTAYALYNFSNGGYEVTYFNQGNKISSEIYKFDKEGALICGERYYQKVLYKDYYNKNNGQKIKMKRYNDFVLNGIGYFEYDQQGNKVMMRIFSSEGKFRGSKKFYKDMVIEETDRDKRLEHKYNSRKLRRTCTYYRDDRFICKFIYERYENDVIKRTLAYDKDNNLMAEYPGKVVYYVNKNMEENHGAESIVYSKPKNW